MSDLPVLTLAALALISLLGGIGITAIGPGGVLVTIGLFVLTDLSPAEIAGSAIVTHIGTGVIGSAAFVRSGQLREPETRRLAIVLCLAACAGTPLGVLLNRRMSSEVFGALLALLVLVVGGLVLAREWRRPRRRAAAPSRRRGVDVDAAQGFGIALISGVFGLGGPMLTVPLLVLGGVPLLPALAAAQAQSIVVASTGAAAYLSAGVISWPIVVLTGVPQLVGVVIGWKIAHALPRRALTFALGGTLIALAPVIAALR